MPPIDVNAELKRRDAALALVDWLLVADADNADTGLSDPVIDQGARDRLDALLARDVLESKGFEQVTVDDTATALTVPAAATRADIGVETASIRYRDDGTDPTTTAGILLEDGDILRFDASLAALRFIRTAGTSATLNVAYYGPV